MAERASVTPSHFLVTVNDVELGDLRVSADDIFRVMMDHQRWQMGELAANRTTIGRGDHLVFYLAGKRRYCFVGTADVASRPVSVPDSSPVLFGNRRLPFMDLEMHLDNIKVWPEPVPARPLLQRLSFVERRLLPYWGLYFRQATRRINAKDFRTIVGAASA